MHVIDKQNCKMFVNIAVITNDICTDLCVQVQK